MNFETEYKNIHFHLTLERASISDASLLLSDKFHRVPNQTMAEIKKGNLVPYNLTVVSKKANQEEERTHFWSNILLTNNPDELMEELGQYLDDESILDSVADNWELKGTEKGPAWKI